MTRKLESIYFAPVREERLSYGMIYTMPAHEKDEDPNVLVLDDKVQREQGPYLSGTISGKRSVHRYPVLGEEIANDLLNAWTVMGLGMTPTCHPGIWLVRDWVTLTDDKGLVLVDADGKPQVRSCTPEELKANEEEDFALAVAADAAYANMLVTNKDFVESLPANDERRVGHNWKNAILAAKYYGYQRSDAWMGKAKISDNKPCPYCQALNPPQMIKCQTCKEIVDPDKYAILKAKEEAALRRVNYLAESQKKAS